MYEYKVDGLSAQVTEKDVNKGEAGAKVAGQVEGHLRDYAKEGWEFYSQNVVTVEVRPGCISALFGNKGDKREIMILVFRRQVR